VALFVGRTREIGEGEPCQLSRIDCANGGTDNIQKIVA
jgi:hypothetical protein